MGQVCAYACNKFHVRSSGGSFMFAIKSKAKCTVHVTAIWLYILKMKTSTNISYFSKMYYHTQFQDLVLSAISVAPT
jgi:hypothetical protein